MGSIHAKLFKDDFFNPYSSYDRIYQILSRLNKILTNNFNFRISNENGNYFLDKEKLSSFPYYLYKEDLPYLSNPQEIFFNQLKNQFKNLTFKNKQASEEFKVSPRTMNRWIKTLVDDSKVLKFGQGKNTTYKIAS